MTDSLESKTGVKAGSHLRMCEEDRVRWGAPEWIDADPSWIFGLRGSKLERMENEMGFSFAQLFEVEIPNYSMRARRALLWLGLKKLGIVLPYVEFDIYTAEVESKVVKPVPVPIPESEGVIGGGNTADPTASGEEPPISPESSTSLDTLAADA